MLQDIDKQKEATYGNNNYNQIRYLVLISYTILKISLFLILLRKLLYQLVDSRQFAKPIKTVYGIIILDEVYYIKGEKTIQQTIIRAAIKYYIGDYGFVVIIAIPIQYRLGNIELTLQVFRAIQDTIVDKPPTQLTDTYINKVKVIKSGLRTSKVNLLGVKIAIYLKYTRSYDNIIDIGLIKNFTDV